MEKKKHLTGVVVSHTHWDRAWYLPFEQFRAKLITLTEKLLKILRENPNFKFTFDGQTIVLEDVLQIRPQWKNKLKEYISKKRLLVGPWYVLADEFLVSGEALIRNLMIGHKISKAFGHTMKVGYTPDPFGHIAQLPQILKGFGIDNAIFMRGVGNEGEKLGQEFWWVAPDGSKVLAHHQVTTYVNAANLNLKEASEKINKVVKRMQPYITTPILFFANGKDHSEPQAEVPEIIKLLNRNFNDINFIQGTPEDFFSLVKKAKPKLKTYEGELHSARYHYHLPGVYSSRIYLKKENFACQNLLEKWVEPFSTLDWLLTRGPYPAQELEFAWKTLLQNHPHDDICGCSIDQVHRDDMERYSKVKKIGNGLLEKALDSIASHLTLKPNAVIAFNPLSWDRAEIQEISVPSKFLKSGILIKDAAGRNLPTQLTKSSILFKPETVPALGYTTFQLSPSPAKTRQGEVKAFGKTIENKFLRITAERNGTLTILDKMSRRTYRRIGLLEDKEDAGDEYDYSPAKKSQTLTSVDAKAKVELTEKGPLRSSITITYDLYLPRGLRRDLAERPSRKVACPVKLLVSLAEDSPRADFQLTFTNRAKDHRLRILFPTDIKTNFSKADEHFQVISRPLDLPDDEKWAQKAVPTQHQENFVSIDNGEHGFSLINAGLPEYEARRDKKGVTLCLTLARAVGILSRQDLSPTRPGDAGPSIPTKDSQCLGKQTFRFALVSHQGDWQSGNIMRLAHQHNSPTRLLFIEKPKVDPGEEALPLAFSLAKPKPKNLLVTAVKKTEERDSLIVRLYNAQPKRSRLRLNPGFKTKNIFSTNLGEERLGQPNPTASPWQIATFELTPGKDKKFTG